MASSKKKELDLKALFQIGLDADGQIKVSIIGTRGDLMRAMIKSAHDDSDIMELMMDSILGAVAKHLREEHGIDLIDMMQKKMEEELGEHMDVRVKKKERVVN